MKCLAIMGSFRKNMNTDTALDAFLNGVEKSGCDVEKIYLGDLDIKNCIGCDNCYKTGECIFDDDMKKLYEKFENSDILVLAAPTYFDTVNALTKSMIDRAQKYWGEKNGYAKNKKNIRKKLGMFVGTGGAKFSHNQFSSTISVVKMFFDAINASFKGAYLISDTDDFLIGERSKILYEIEELGENFISSGKFIIQRM